MQAIEKLLASMRGWKASDLFVCEGKAPAVRIHGAVVALEAPPTQRQEVSEFLDGVLEPRLRKAFEESGDLDLGYSLDDQRRFRINVARQHGLLSLVARYLPSGELKVEDLGLPPTVAALAELPRGLVLVTGATGSGKSTTLAALIHRINSTRQVHVVTVEDPIEFVHNDIRARISQREVGTDTQSFAAALKHVVRESPDVILVGEMRDAETMQVALQASLTGHLVFATLHTVNASQTLQRVLAYFPEHLRTQAAMDLSLSVKGIVSQRLLPRVDGQGRALAVEVLTVTPPAARLIREQRVDELADLMRATNDPSIVTFNRSLLELYRRGLIDFEQGQSYATNPEEFALSAKGMETGVAAFRAGAEGEATTELDMKALLTLAMERGASDLHLSVGRPPILRIFGELESLPFHPLTAADMRILLYSILSNRQRSTYELEREVDLALALDDGRRFRVNAYYQKGNMAAALRTIPTEVPSADALGLPDALVGLARRPHGLLLVVGPTGSGKTTTLACLVDRINEQRACRMITVEDPIEYVHASKRATIDQREVGADTRTFGAALKYILRQDPDVVLIGEMRDFETISSALTAAETGHLVLATLHTNDAVQTIDRIVDAFPSHQQNQARIMLSSALLAVVSQRLFPRAAGAGRTAVFETMIATPAIRTLIRENKMHQALSMMETSGAQGNVTMDKALVEAYKAGRISYDSALRYLRNPKVLGARPQAAEQPDVTPGAEGAGSAARDAPARGPDFAPDAVNVNPGPPQPPWVKD
jgi:twitching motility protein PilT